RTKYIAAGALAGLLLLAGIIVKVRDKDGNVVAEVNVPNGATVEVVPQPATSGTTPRVPAFVPTQAAAAGDYTLRFARSNNSKVEAPNVGLDVTQPFTVEAYVTAGDNSSGSGNSNFIDIPDEFGLRLTNNCWTFYTFHSQAVSATPYVAHRRVHLAGIRTATKRSLYVDGKLVDSKDEPQPTKRAGNGKLGPLMIISPGPDVTIDELRISQTARHDANFTPQPKLTADKDTLALYHFDEGSGDVLKDSSGKGRHGKITGATWVKSDGSPIPAISTSTVPASNGAVYLDDLPETELKVFNFGKHGLDTSGKPVEWRGRQPQHCLYMHPLTDAEPSTVTYSLNGRFEALNATVGLLNTKAETTLTFRVLGDGRELWKSPLIQNVTDEAVCSVSVASVRELRLEVICKGGTYNVNGGWIEPRLTPAISAPQIPAEALTFGGHRYLLVDSFSTWSEAKAKAEALGGHLATITSKGERDWILTNVFQKRPRGTDRNDLGLQIFLGGSHAGGNSSWTWITGEPLDASLWLGSMPTVVEKSGLSWIADDRWYNKPIDDRNSRSNYFLVEWDTPGPAAVATSGLPPSTADQATVAAWLLENKKLARIGFEIDGRKQNATTVPTGPLKVFELNFSKFNNSGKPLSEEEVARLAAFTDLESLELSTLTDAGLAKLAPLKKLKSLIVPGSELTPAAVATIRQFPLLEHLHAFGDDEWLKPLAGMPSLRSMVFWKVKVSPQAMSWFPQYPNLKELTFYECIEVEKDPKSFVAIAPLKDCKNLSKLTLAGSAINSADLAVLSGFTQLLELNLNASTRTEAEVRQLAAALPRCKITWTDAANKKTIFEPTVTTPAASLSKPLP
ncbi:MAG: NPCBM/NEW2 domain-containing protein, partial [Planctomycetia bacterium]|nr:NPCBM/NEW2 domain-containing protein [Planctomycetia bacterium]